MATLADLPDVLLVIIVGGLCSGLTQFTSNLAAAAIMLPIVISMVSN